MQNKQLMQMIYALEWYDIPRSAYSDLVEFHPYLTESDYDKLFYVNTQNRIENGVSMISFSKASEIAKVLEQSAEGLLVASFHDHVKAAGINISSGLRTSLAAVVQGSGKDNR